ncbi:hypothetical protein [Deinococcus maricopensis]|uniref:Uncharacterized protein n=1 Tax=Deinococcus maricopensis (strain DSM 21211 / LMG 22137 / NRRL B-23946 / LB-34) TaxID=709986 RepID=E8U4U6_DEIML|nr:hypothetical protein [Deinococcus maricopensis]ADV66085.1 hypothetical protein Deima_0425 [Deinococcus maricopensis DSM 21211]
MGFRSVVFGHVQTLDQAAHAANERALRGFPYDEMHPFRDIFHLEPAARYKAPSVIFGGTFKALEDDWAEWFGSFVALLSTLEATEANVVLDCWRGRFAWTLMPESLAGGACAPDLLEARGTLTREQWCIVRAPDLPEEVQGVLHPGRVPVRLLPDVPYGF